MLLAWTNCGAVMNLASHGVSWPWRLITRCAWAALEGQNASDSRCHDVEGPDAKTEQSGDDDCGGRRHKRSPVRYARDNATRYPT
jgi:hypothetical protein